MAHITAASDEYSDADRGFTGLRSQRSSALGSAVSWGAVAAGAVAAASLSLILLILGVGLGLSSVSPWARDGINAATFGVSTILWLSFTQLMASAMGGYLAGRLRTKWTEVHSDEVYFRDTAHGFLAWAVASLATAALLSSVIGSILGGGVQAGATVAGGMASTAGTALGGSANAARGAQGSDGAGISYFVDTLVRRDVTAAATAAAAGATPSTTTSATAPEAALPAANTGAQAPAPDDAQRAARDAAEVGRIFMNVGRAEPLPAEDKRHVGQLVAQRTGLSQAEAEQRVDRVHARAQAQWRDSELAARDAADKARKASAYGALWLFVSLLIGAFIASLTATFGGRRRDA